MQTLQISINMLVLRLRNVINISVEQDLTLHPVKPTCNRKKLSTKMSSIRGRKKIVQQNIYTHDQSYTAN